jgi:hypothetical protein
MERNLLLPFVSRLENFYTLKLLFWELFVSENGILSEIIRKENILGSQEAQLGGGFEVFTLSICSSMQNTAILVHNLMNILDSYSVHY